MYRLFPLLFLLHFQVSAQVFFPAKKYPSNFRNPLDIPLSLVGNFGECRANHFHSGIDIRTDSKENQLVYAIEGGYVSRIKIEPGGFGNAIYITHPGGYTSLYAHLNQFYPELEAFVRNKQYETKSWKQDLYVVPYQFPIRKGSFIARSGNTGSSEGPHLHMEIRNTKTEAPLNGLLFYPQWPDQKPPVIKQIAVYDATTSIYEQSPQMQRVSKKKDRYLLPADTILCSSSSIYFGIAGDDFMEAATGTLGIFEMRMYVDDKPYFAWQMDNISYDITRYMNAMADYKTKKNDGPWIQLCHQLPNDKLPIYKSFTSKRGVVDLNDSIPRKVKIEVYDTKRNSTTVEFFVKRKMYSRKETTCEMTFSAGKKNTFHDANIALTLNEDALYDDICFRADIKAINSPYSYRYQIHSGAIPVHSYFDLYLKPKADIPTPLQSKIALVRLPYGGVGSKKGQKGNWESGQVVARIREFGNYEIVIDEIPPQIVSTIKNNDVVSKLDKLSFVVKDETTSVLRCTATVDGQWLRMVQKGDTYTYEMDDHFPLGTHLFSLSAEDENGNLSTTTYTLTR